LFPELFHRNKFKNMKVSSGHAASIVPIARELSKRYKNFGHYNRKNPLDELLLILCSVKRGEKVYLRAFKSLKQAFPTFEKLNQASVKELTEQIEWGGLQNQKARSLKKITTAITERFGKLSLAPLRKKTEEECEEFLRSLPGIGKKVARCVMLYSLGIKVFPVDTHCWRISKRLGWIRANSKHKFCTSQDMDNLQDTVPPKLRLSLHVNMVSLGREFCLARSPKCHQCPIVQYCWKRGVVRIRKKLCEDNVEEFISSRRLSRPHERGLYKAGGSARSEWVSRK
jgi:endonuclease III